MTNEAGVTLTCTNDGCGCGHPFRDSGESPPMTDAP